MNTSTLIIAITIAVTIGTILAYTIMGLIFIALRKQITKFYLAIFMEDMNSFETDPASIMSNARDIMNKVPYEPK